MVDIERQEQPKAERIIQLGEEFHPFDPKYVQKKIHSSKYAKLEGGIPHIEVFYSPRIVLDLENKYRVSSTVSAQYGLPYYHDGPVGRLHQDYGALAKHNVLTPFDPKSGYQINSQDFNIAHRIDKVRRAISKQVRREQQYRNVDVPLKLFAPASTEFPFKLPLNMIEALKMQVFFGEKSFEAAVGPGITAASGYTFYFDVFYPTDKGPLSTTNKGDRLDTLEDTGLGLREGLYIFLPSDSEKLSQIRAKFVLAEQDPQKA